MELGSSICYGVYLVTVGVATTPDDDQGVANDGYSRQQPYTEAQEEVAHEVLARAELVSWRFTLELVDVASQTAEPELIRNSGQDKQLSEQNYGMSTTATSGSVISTPLSITTFLAKCRVSVVKRNFIDRKI